LFLGGRTGLGIEGKVGPIGDELVREGILDLLGGLGITGSILQFKHTAVFVIVQLVDG